MLAVALLRSKQGLTLEPLGSSVYCDTDLCLDKVDVQLVGSLPATKNTCPFLLSLLSSIE